MRSANPNLGTRIRQTYYLDFVERGYFIQEVTYRYNLRWPMIVDMMNTHASYNLEACQLRYYSVTKLILKYRYDQNSQLTLEEENILNYP